MSLKRLALCAGFLLLALSLATAAQARKFSVVGGGGQTHIGNGLMLPIQAAATAGTTGTVFPGDLPLTTMGGPGVNPRGLKVGLMPGNVQVDGTTAKLLKTAMSFPTGPTTKRGYQRTLNIPKSVLGKGQTQTTVGVRFSNPTLWAVGTGISYRWPSAPVVFNDAVGSLATVANFGGTMTYSNTLGARFGGPGFFSLDQAAPSGIVAGAGATLYAAAPPYTAMAPVVTGAPIVGAMPLPGPVNLGHGGATAMTVGTAGVVVPPLNVALVSVGTSPSGTILAFMGFVATGAPTNAAMSQPGPWTSGKIIISNPAAFGGLEKFTLSGKDSRDALGNGMLSMVSGALSTRVTTGPNANRGWLRLDLSDHIIPASSPVGLAAAAGLLLLVGGYAVRRYFVHAAA